LLIACAVVALLPLLGCQEDGIVARRVPIPEPPEPKVRLLGAMIPHDKDIWFFKMVGKLDAIEPLKGPFEDFVRSVRFDKPGEPIAWTPPKDWQQLPQKSADRYATFQLGARDSAPDLTVHRYDAARQMASIRDNVARWGRMYVGVKVTLENIDDFIRQDKTAEGGAEITFVDMKGPGGKGGGMAAPFAGGANPHEAAEDPHAPAEKLTYKAPEGWKETDRVVKRGGIEVRYEAALKVEDGGASALLTVSKFPDDAGGLLANVNRWRDQVGLPRLSEEQLTKQGKKVEVGGGKGLAVDFEGKERRVVGAIVSRKGMTWFIKMDGPAELVGKQKAAFDKFVGSVKFDGGNGG
jgi:hypothetical protein